MRKGYFFDIDGTLYSHRYHDVQASAIQALQLLQKHGQIVCAATSRASCEWDHLPKILRDFPFDARIMDGGPVIYENRELVKEVALPSSILKKISDYCFKEKMCWKYSTLEGTYWGNQKVTRAMLDVCWHCYLSLPVYQAYTNQKVYNVIVYFEKDEQRKEMEEIVRDCSTIAYFDCLEIRPSRCDKKDSIAYLKEYFDLEQVICFGDGDNDVDMLIYANKGIAMGNGQRRCKEAADQIIGSCQEDSIYTFIMEEEEWSTY